MTNRTRTLINATAVAIIAVALIVGFNGTASATIPTVTGTTTCRPAVNVPWVVQWTVHSGESNKAEQWDIEIPRDVYPAGLQPVPSIKGRTASYPPDLEAVTETVRTRYYVSGELVKKATRSATVTRPPICDRPDNTATTNPDNTEAPPSSTTSTTPTTSLPPSSTTSTEPATSTSTPAPTTTAPDPTSTSSPTTTSLPVTTSSSKPPSPVPPQIGPPPTPAPTLPATGPGPSNWTLATIATGAVLVGLILLNLRKRPT